MNTIPTSLVDGDTAEVYDIRNSPGPANLMRFDILVTWRDGGQVLYPDVTFSNPTPDDYDVIGAKKTSQVAMIFRGNELRFWIPWMPVTTDCVAPPPPAPIRMPLDPAMRAVMAAGGTTTIPIPPTSTNPIGDKGF